MRTFTLLCKAIRQAYPVDYFTPGVHISWVNEETGWYGAVHRYPPGQRTMIVCKLHHRELDSLYAELARLWLLTVEPPTNAITDLRVHLRHTQ